MDGILGIAIVMEMLAVNLFTVDMCSTRKYSYCKTFLLELLFTVVLTAITNDWWEPLGFGQGNALFALIGIVYLIPISQLYKEPVLHLSGLLFSAWIYTLLVYCVSVRIAYMLPAGRFILRVLSIQTILYVITLCGFLHWIKKEFQRVLHNLSRKNQCLLQVVSLCWFGSIILISGTLIYQTNALIKFLVIISINVDAVMSYWLIASMLKSSREVKSLRDIVYTDPLTGIFNREKLFVDAEALIHKRRPFRLVFMDLNHFKSVNDQYGHQAGDRYLTEFARATKALLQADETLYRLSGDEFVILSPVTDRLCLVEKLRKYPQAMGGVAFLGVSIGWADYPNEKAELDQLIALADQRMYLEKHPGDPMINGK